MKKLIPVILLIAGLYGVAASCKQADGEFCQIDSDCESGHCTQAEHVCAGTGQSTAPFDANLPEAIDAIDAPKDTGDAADAATD